MIREVVNGVLRKPFVVVWNQMDGAFKIVTKTNAFRTPQQANAFIRDLPRKEGFIRIDHIYSRNNGLPIPSYD